MVMTTVHGGTRAVGHKERSNVNLKREGSARGLRRHRAFGTRGVTREQRAARRRLTGPSLIEQVEAHVLLLLLRLWLGLRRLGLRGVATTTRRRRFHRHRAAAAAAANCGGADARREERGLWCHHAALVVEGREAADLLARLHHRLLEAVHGVSSALGHLLGHLAKRRGLEGANVNLVVVHALARHG